MIFVPFKYFPKEQEKIKYYVRKMKKKKKKRKQLQKSRYKINIKPKLKKKKNVSNITFLSGRYIMRT